MTPKGWKKTTIGALCELVNGNGFKSTEWDTVGLPIIRIQNLNGSREFNYFNGEPKDRWLVQPGDLLFAWAGVKGVSFGPCMWSGPPGVLNQHIFRVIPKTSVSCEFLHALLRMTTQRIEANSHGFKANFVHVQKGDIVDQSIYVPPLPEQQKIAAILSTWDRAIELTEKLIAAKQKRKQALTVQLFASDWPLKKLADLTSILTDGTHFSPEVNGGPFKYITSKNIRPGRLALEKCDYICEEQHREIYRTCPVEFGDLLLTKDGANTGNACLYDLHEEASLLSSVALLRGIPDVLNNNFLMHFILSPIGQYVFTNEMSGQAITRLTLKTIGSIRVPAPSIETQIPIANALDAMGREVSVLQRRVSLLQQQKKGLMQQLLTGKVRVKVDAETEQV